MDEQRAAFEAWISAPPREYSTAKFKTLWPLLYKKISVQVAWEAWQAAIEQSRKDALTWLKEQTK